MVNTIFLGIAVVASAIFLIQFIMSIFFGDLDTDTDIDVDLSSAVSFKGLNPLLHRFRMVYVYCQKYGYLYFPDRHPDRVALRFYPMVSHKKAYQLQKKTNRKRQKPWW